MTNPDRSPGAVVPLAGLRREDRRVAGVKAANLGELAASGFPVPEGFVVNDEPNEEIEVALRRLGDGPWAVRSSATAEDLAEASFAGQYDTVLNVRGSDALLNAIRRVRDSGKSSRVQQYRASHGDSEHSKVAVLVQRMLSPDAAGVGFTANPITGERGATVIIAARGLGERVVSGEAIGDEWSVQGGEASCHRLVEGAIDSEQAVAIADLARRVETHFGGPQDVEWAIEAGRLFVLQARPMTALPEPVSWTPPAPGYWMRNFRLGEWLSEPMTPLFQDWLLERIEGGYLMGMREVAGASLPFPHVAINGWYYTSAPSPKSIPLLLMRAIAESRGRVLWVLFHALVRVNDHPEKSDRHLLRGLTSQWREVLLPPYRQVVADLEDRIEVATSADLVAAVDRVGLLAGEYLWYLAIVGGSAWKMEGCLARFLRQHLDAGLVESSQSLLRGLPGVDLGVPAHAVQSVDWYWPTAGELPSLHPSTSLDERKRSLALQREAVELACRTAFTGQSQLLSRFESLLDVAQRYAAIREEQVRWFTLGWPLLRRCVLRLGEGLRTAGVIDSKEDVFFLMRSELEAGAQLQDIVRQRRSVWESQRRLAAPLSIGRAPRLLKSALSGVTDAVRTNTSAPEGAIVGEPASPGRAIGPVRIVRSPEDFERFQSGDVLVARATAPAWTPLFARAAAVVTDGGTLAAHASLVAREYGIPAVVGTGDATNRLREGDRVLVDGNAGTVSWY